MKRLSTLALFAFAMGSPVHAGILGSGPFVLILQSPFQTGDKKFSETLILKPGEDPKELDLQFSAFWEKHDKEFYLLSEPKDTVLPSGIMLRTFYYAKNPAAFKH